MNDAITLPTPITGADAREILFEIAQRISDCAWDDWMRDIETREEESEDAENAD